MNELKNQINIANQNEDDTLHRKIIAVGECGLDHHWNPSGEDGRDINDFDKKTYEGERELFQMQIELARELNLPVIVHSRDAFEDTLECIKEVGYHNGIIHCYSYGLEEAKSFLDLGWYISLSGSVTYTKKNKMEEMQKMIQAIPNHRLLCETDAPYLAPVPMRGQINTPVLVEHTYNFVATAKNMPVEELSALVDKNVKDLFKI
jgi:TatD DNase family protein